MCFLFSISLALQISCHFFFLFPLRDCLLSCVSCHHKMSMDTTKLRYENAVLAEQCSEVFNAHPPLVCPDNKPFFCSSLSSMSHHRRCTRDVQACMSKCRKAGWRTSSGLSQVCHAQSPHTDTQHLAHDAPFRRPLCRLPEKAQRCDTDTPMTVSSSFPLPHRPASFSSPAQSKSACSVFSISPTFFCACVNDCLLSFSGV